MEGEVPYLWLDALYVKVRQNHRIVNLAMVIPIGVRETGERGVLAFAFGGSEEQAFWLDFLRGLVRRALQGVQLVTSDAHEGLKTALGQVLSGVTWQRCPVHFTLALAGSAGVRNILAHVPQRDKSMVAAGLRTIFAQPGRDAGGEQLDEVLQPTQARWPKAAELLTEAEEDVLAYMAFPPEHWSRIYSTNPLERLNKESKCQTYVVGVSPDEASVIRSLGLVLMRKADEWQVNRRYFPGLSGQDRQPGLDAQAEGSRDTACV